MVGTLRKSLQIVTLRVPVPTRPPLQKQLWPCLPHPCTFYGAEPSVLMTVKTECSTVHQFYLCA